MYLLSVFQIISKSTPELENAVRFPMCDGGEYTLDVLRYYMDCKEHFVNDVVNPYGKRVSCRYLSTGDSAYIAASEIIRLYPEEDEYKNPLDLTDYGLGQLISHALLHGFKKINLCLGGTSTVCFGMGMVQALGVLFLDCKDEVISTPITPMDFHKIKKFVLPKNRYLYDITVINDGMTKSSQLASVNAQKIGIKYLDRKEMILSKLEDAANEAERITGISRETEFSGNAGGIYYGLELYTNASYRKGAEYFIDAFGLDNAIKESDLVITGEGKFDNPHLKKLPVIICEHAQKYDVPVLFICGQKESSMSNEDLKYLGIIDIICCQDYYENVDSTISYIEMVDIYKKQMPGIIRHELSSRLRELKEYV